MTAQPLSTPDLQGTIDPVATALQAPVGVMFRRTDTGDLFIKTGVAAGSWTKIVQPAFVAGGGAGSAVQNNNTGNAAAGVDALASGNGSTASGDNSAAFNESSAQGVGSFAVNEAAAVGNFSLASGGSTANGQFDAALGNGCVTNGGGLGAFAAGNGCGANAPSSGAIGNGASANGDSSVALCEGFTRAGAVAALSANVSLVEAGGTWASAFGSSAAAGKATHAIGENARALRESQSSHGSGRFAANGDAQASGLVLRGSTPGLAANESVELLYGALDDQVLSLEDTKAYVVHVRAIGYAHDTNFMSFDGTFAVNQEGGVITIKPAAPDAIPQVTGTAGAATWTLTVDTAALPTRVSFTFATGIGTTAAVRVAADISFVEVARS